MLQCNICIFTVFISEIIRYFNGDTLENNALLSEIKRI